MTISPIESGRKQSVMPQIAIVSYLVFILPGSTLLPSSVSLPTKLLYMSNETLILSVFVMADNAVRLPQGR